MPLVGNIWCDEPGRGSVMLRSCSKTARERMAKGCEARRPITGDEALIDGDTEKLIDSAQAFRILKACGNNLEKDDLLFLIEMLVSADKLTSGEATAVKNSLDPPAQATDHRTYRPGVTAADAWARRGTAPNFPNAGRLKA